jgi:nitrogen regulatory protein PII
LEQIVQTIVEIAHLGEQGDGFNFVTGIVDMVDIRTGISLADQSGDTAGQCA